MKHDKAEALNFREPFRRLRFLDWVFVAFTGVLIWYSTFLILEYSNPDAVVGLDYMPLLAGVAVIALGWHAVRTDEQVRSAIDGLDEGAGLEVANDQSLGAFHAGLARGVRWWSWGVAGALALILLIAFVSGAITGSFTVGEGPVGAVLAYSLGIVMVCVGGVVGWLLGRFIGFGRLHAVMTSRGVSLAGISTPHARRALRALQNVNRYATLVTTGICAWLAVWWVLWHLDLETDYRTRFVDWFPLYWFIAFLAFLLAVLGPAHAFEKRLDRTYGAANRKLADAQRTEAEQDRNAIAALTDPTRAQLAELAELRSFIRDLAERRFSSVWLERRFLNSLVAANAILFLGPAIYNPGLFLKPWLYRFVPF